MVNTQVEKDGKTIEFTREIVEELYELLPNEEKYLIDKAGNIFKLDPVGVVRNALERMQYQLDPAWYSWGTKVPGVVDSNVIIYRGTNMKIF